MANIEIDYTDIAGIRNNITKTVPLYLAGSYGTGTSAGTGTYGTGAALRTRKTSVATYFYYALAVIIGIVIGLVLMKVIRRKKKKTQ